MDEHMQLIMLAIGIIGAFCTIFGVWYKMDRDTNAKIDSISKTFSDQLAKAMSDLDTKRARIYERIDEVKQSHKEEIGELRKEAMENYVPTKICTLMHSSSEKSMSELKNSFEKSIGELKTAIANVDTKVEEVKTKLYEKNGAEK